VGNVGNGGTWGTTERGERGYEKPSEMCAEGSSGIYLGSFRRSVVPSFRRSVVPSFRRSVVPSFRRSVVPSFRRSVALPIAQLDPLYSLALCPGVVNAQGDDAARLLSLECISEIGFRPHRLAFDR
jgi:hypothetical protein